MLPYVVWFCSGTVLKQGRFIIEIFQLLLHQFLKNRNFWQICTICISNESWKRVIFNYDTKKWNLWPFFWEKLNFLNFCLYFDKIFFFEIQNFQNFFIQPPKFIPYTNFKHQKWKLQGGFIIVPLPYWTGRASKQAASWFLPPWSF